MRRLLPLHYRVLGWALLPMLALTGFALLHTSLNIQQARAALEAESATLETRIQRAFDRRLETLGGVAKLLAESDEVTAAVTEHRGDWLYQWSRRFIGSGLAERITIADADGIVIARGHHEFAFGDSLTDSIAFRAAVDRGGFTGALELDSTPGLVAAVPIYRFDTLLSGVVIVSGGITLALLEEFEQAAGGRLGVDVAGHKIGHFPSAAERGENLVNRFALRLPTLDQAPIRVTHTQDLTRRVGVLQRLNQHLLLFGVAAIGLVVPLVAVSTRRLLHPLRQLHHRLARFSRREMGLDELIDDISSLQRVGGEVGAIASSVGDGLRELRRVQDELTRSEQRAQAANHAKSEFLANMSHEIRTPINAVIGFTELLERGELNPTQREHLRSVKIGGNSLLTLINDILDLSKIEAGAMKLEYGPVNLRALFVEIERVFSQRVEEKQLHLILDPDPRTPPALRLDEARLRQVLLNLVGNAVKFTDHGVIHLTTEVKPAGEGRIDLRIKVADTGIGIAPADREKIFDAFEQSDGQSTRRYGGTGLGLAISRKLVEMMAGDLTLDSTVGKGSAFTLTLRDVVPLAAPPPLVEEEAPAGWPRLAPCTVLVVDDTPSNRELLRAVLEAHGATVVTAEGGRDALAIAAATPPDLILMDLKMPGMDGYEATRRLRARPALAAIPVVAVTASVDEREHSRIGLAGFDDQLRKPLNGGELRRVLRRFLPHLPGPASSDDEGPPGDLPPSEGGPLPDELVTALETLRGELGARGGGGNLPRLRHFSAGLALLAEEYPVEPLTSYTDRLTAALTAFDIERIERILGGLPALIERLRPTAKPPTEGDGI